MINRAQSGTSSNSGWLVAADRRRRHTRKLAGRLCLTLLFGILGVSSSALAADPDTCVQGYVWREAFSGDHVCVTSAVRDQAAQDNNRANPRKAPGGAYGPDTCAGGYVWRAIRPADHVCVTPESRSQAAADNGQAAARRAKPASFANDVAGWDENGFAVGVNRSDTLSDLIFTWKCRPPKRYDAFNVRVRISDGREGQVEVAGGDHGSYRERNASVGKTYTFLVQGCNKGTFHSTCDPWAQLSVVNDRNLR